MNKQIIELANKANKQIGYTFKLEDAKQIHELMAKFAELIDQEYRENFAKVWYEQGLDIRGAELGKFLTRFDEHFGVKE